MTETPPGVDITVPSAARVYDYSIGGHDNFPVDRAAADQILAQVPESRDSAVNNRRFLGRAVTHLVAECGIRQFLDIGSGLPTQGNVHEIAQSAASDARVVYVDSDELTHNHAVALLDGDPRAAFVVGDVREPDKILASPEVARLIDWEQPVGILCVALLHFVHESHDPAALVRAFTGGAVPGSALALSHLTLEGMPADVEELIDRVYGSAPTPLIPRSREWIQGLFPWAPIDPGLVLVQHWRNPVEVPAGRLDLLGGVAVKP